MYMGVSLNSFVYLKFGNPLPGLSADPTTKIARHGQGGVSQNTTVIEEIGNSLPIERRGFGFA